MAGSIKRDQIIDQYKIKNLTGQDQFKDYYSAYEIDTGKHVTLTVLRPEYVQFDLFKQDYLNRTQSLTQIRHPNLITCLQTGFINDSQPYLAVEPFSGFSLSERLDHLAREEEFAHATYALTIIKQIASGLALLERLNLYHYQLTPDFVLLKSVTLKNEECIVVTSLDIPSQYASEFRGNSDFSGPYLSPEQLSRNQIDGRSHVYSLGVILHELLCGQVPDRPLTPWRKMWSTLSGGSTLAQARPNLAAATNTLVEQSLYKSRRRRIPSLEVFLREVEKALAVEEAPATHAVAAEPVPQQRRTFMIPIFLLILCILLGLFAVRYVPGLRAIPTPTVAVASAELTTAIAGGESAPALPSRTPGSTTTPVPSRTPTEQFLRRTNTADEKPSIEAPLVTELYETPLSEEILQPESTATATATATATEIATATDTPIPTETPRPTFRIVPNSANVRVGPGTVYDVSGYVYQGEGLEILGRNSGEFIWLNIRTDSGEEGWVAADVGQLEGTQDLSQIAIAATIPPLPTPTMTPTPTNTPIPPTPIPSSPSPSDSSGGGNNGGGNNGGGGSDPRPTPTPAL